MTKPWEETWLSDGETIARRHRDGEQSILVRTFHQEIGREEHEVLVRLAACAPEMARMLLGFEHAGCDRYGDAQCTGCGSTTVGHAEGCAWLALMRKAGVR